MERLRQIIGSAPSEMALEDFLYQLSAERNRVSRELTAAKERMATARRRPKKSRKKASLAKQALNLLNEKGIDLDELEKILGGKN